MKLQLDFVSDVSCPWCIIGYAGLAQAMAQLPNAIEIELTFMPFEINADMAPEGEPLASYLSRKYGMSASQRADNIATLTKRGLEVGFEFMPLEQRHVYNSFDCHRLLHLALQHQLQIPLKLALFEAYFRRGVDISNKDMLHQIAIDVGLNTSLVDQLLDSDLYRTEVRQLMQKYQQSGVSAVPMLIINNKYGIPGAQTAQGYLEILQDVIRENS